MNASYNEHIKRFYELDARLKNIALQLNVSVEYLRKNVNLFDNNTKLKVSEIMLKQVHCLKVCRRILSLDRGVERNVICLASYKRKKHAESLKNVEKTTLCDEN